MSREFNCCCKVNVVLKLSGLKQRHQAKMNNSSVLQCMAEIFICVELLEISTLRPQAIQKGFYAKEPCKVPCC